MQIPHETQEIHVTKDWHMFYVTDIKRSAAEYIQATINICKNIKTSVKRHTEIHCKLES